MKKKYKIKFENEPEGNRENTATLFNLLQSAIILNTLQKFSEMYILPIRRYITSLSKINTLSWDGGNISRLNSSILPITTPHFFHSLQVKQFIQQGGTITGIHSIIRCKQDYILKDFMNEIRKMREQEKQTSRRISTS